MKISSISSMYRQTAHTRDIMPPISACAPSYMWNLSCLLHYNDLIALHRRSGPIPTSVAYFGPSLSPSLKTTQLSTFVPLVLNPKLCVIDGLNVGTVFLMQCYFTYCVMPPVSHCYVVKVLRCYFGWHCGNSAMMHVVVLSLLLR